MPSNQSVFQRTAGVRPARSMFDLSYSKLFNCDGGQLIPVMCDEVIPGDIIKIGNQCVCRVQPQLAPILHQIDIDVHYFEVPYRILWHNDEPVAGDWEEFITGGDDGTNSDTLPTWTPATANTALYSLWDYLGWPTGANDSSGAIKPLAFPMYAYNMIWNEWYRDTWIDSEVNLDDKVILNRRWNKDYFSAALTSQQRGTAPSLPLSGTGSAEWPSDRFLSTGVGDVNVTTDSGSTGDSNEVLRNSGASANARANLEGMFNDWNTFDFADATTFDVADLRLAFQQQRWLERNARCGSRYREFLLGHYGITIPDETVQIPRYLGGSKQGLVISEVIQTSESNTTKQGTMVGHALSAAGNNICTVRVKEFGLIMGLLSIMPKAAYSQGINRQWLKETKYDFYSPEFAFLSESAIFDGELFFAADSTDKATFGFIGMWDWMRCKHDMYCADMRGGEAFEHWHLGRHFAAEPSLNSTFLECDPTTRYLAVTSEPAFIVHFQNNILAFRPIPVMSAPGLIDH